MKTGEEHVSKKIKEFSATVAAIAIAALSSVVLSGGPSTAVAQQANEPAIDGDDIGGVVSGPNGPEAGVWVIAETRPANQVAKIVVTDDQGRYVMPDLPAANYSVWVRGYGWWIRRSCGQSRASTLISPRCRRRTRRRRRITIQRSTGTR